MLLLGVHGLQGPSSMTLQALRLSAGPLVRRLP